MIEIKIEAASGAEARAELLNLLGITSNVVITVDPVQVNSIELNPDREVAATEEVPSTTPTRKRRTQAEIKAEEAAKAETPVEPATEEISDMNLTLMQDNADQNKPAEVPTLQDLQRECAILVRAGFKDKGVEFIKTIGGADNSKAVPDEKREAVITAMAAFIEENKITR